MRKLTFLGLLEVLTRMHCTQQSWSQIREPWWLCGEKDEIGRHEMSYKGKWKAWKMNL